MTRLLLGVATIAKISPSKQPLGRMTTTTTTSFQGLRYYLAEHPSVVGFRWSHAQSWGSTWPFLVTFITLYVAGVAFLHCFLLLVFPRRRFSAIPLGPIPAGHAFTMAVVSVIIFLGTILSAAAEIRDTRWQWRRSRATAFQWLLCFPLGTRPSGRVFFWSYVHYLSRFGHALRPVITVFRRRRMPWVQVLHQSAAIFMAFLWLEFSQSVQVLEILSTTMACSVVYGYRIWTAMGLPGGCFLVVVNCQMVLLSWNMGCHVAVVILHLVKGGCNGIGAWIFNSFLNGTILCLFLNFYLKVYHRRRNSAGAGAGSFPVKHKDV